MEKLLASNISADAATKILHKVFKKHKPLRLGLSGPLGVGKTEFVRRLINELDKNLAVKVKSPTFSYCNIYQGKIRVSHLDLYCLQSVEDLYRIAVWDYIDFSDLVVVEWADKFPELMRGFNFLLEIEWVDNTLRQYHLREF